ncbi:pol [Symbiodinium sp. CCMP2456]|nr:pol [Symbiodinium sp. CCMP2456]
MIGAVRGSNIDSHSRVGKWIRVDELLQQLKKRHQVEIGHRMILSLVAHDNKGRFILFGHVGDPRNDYIDCGIWPLWISASHGHSARIMDKVDDSSIATVWLDPRKRTVDRVPAAYKGKPFLCRGDEGFPPRLYHRTTHDAAFQILEDGLIPGFRDSGKYHNYFAKATLSELGNRAGVRANLHVELVFDTVEVLKHAYLFETESEGPNCSLPSPEVRIVPGQSKECMRPRLVEGNTKMCEVCIPVETNNYDTALLDPPQTVRVVPADNAQAFDWPQRVTWQRGGSLRGLDSGEDCAARRKDKASDRLIPEDVEDLEVPPGMDTSGSSPKRAAEEADGPRGKRREREGGTGAVAGLDLDQMERLLEAHSTRILKAQRENLEGMMSFFEAKTDEKLKRVEDKADGADRRAAAIEDKVEQLQGQVAELLRRSVILQQLGEALERLQLRDCLDAEPFCTGNTVAIPHGKTLFATYSKTRAERAVAAHAAWVKRSLSTLGQDVASLLDVEYNTGTCWIGGSTVASATRPSEPGVHEKHLMRDENEGHKTWVDIEAIARETKHPHKDILRALEGERVDEAAVPQVLRDLDVSETEHIVYLLQEVPRREPGWHTDSAGGWSMLSHRPEGRWRGAGIIYKELSWKIVRRIATERGIWLRLRHVTFGNLVRVGSAHFDPGCTQAVHRAAVEEHLHRLRPTTLPIILAADINSPIRWEEGEDGDVCPVGRDGKTVGYLEAVAGRGLQLAAPHRDQYETPTSRPRQGGRQGRQIDCIASRGALVSRLRIFEGTSKALGTDHDMLQCKVYMTADRERTVHSTRPRVWIGGPSMIDKIDQPILREMARTCTKPKPNKGYKDPPEVKAAVTAARLSQTGVAWKEVQNQRKLARRRWEAQRITAAMEGLWDQVRQLRATKNTGWDTHYAECQGEGEAHRSIHDHLSNIYQTGNELPPLEEWKGEVQAFTEEELKAALASGKTGKAVGVDQTSLELLRGICATEGGMTHLLEFYNGILCTANIPPDWNRAVMVVIPKVTYPSEPGELRPLAMGSAAAKIFTRMLLTRSEPLLGLKGPEQCSGKGRQCCDFLFTVARLMQLEQEWKQGVCWLKVDLAKAFDRVDRRTLTNRLRQRMGMTPEFRCWYNLLRGTDAVLQTGWDSTVIDMQDGIKQGAIESPSFFSFLAETCLHEASARFKWTDQPRTFSGLDLDNLLYMDDGLQWSQGIQGIESRVAQWGVVLQEFGLRINAKKCQLYCSPFHNGKRTIRVQGELLYATEDLHILGMTFRVGITPSETIAPLLSKARAKFWGGLRHLLRAKTPIGGRVRFMERVLGGTVLWPLAALPMDRASLGLINSLQLQMCIWLMRVAKRNEPMPKSGGRLCGWRGGGHMRGTAQGGASMQT